MRQLRYIDAPRICRPASKVLLRTLGLGLVVLALSSMRLPGQEAPATADAQSQKVAAWVHLLDSDVYADRQAAMQNLKRSGAIAAVELAKAARASNLEVTARAIELLTQMYESADAEVAMAADEALESLAQNGPPVAVVRTKEVFETTLAPLRRRHAISSIKRLGGHVIPRLESDDEGQEVEADLNELDTVQHVVLGKKWKGGLDGLKYLLRLPELRVLYITNDLPLTAAEIGSLKEILAGMRIEPRGSAYLGITSLLQDPEFCIINSVVPNSPAKIGGLRPGDLITHVDGLPIRGFLELTGRLTLRKGGDLVYLEVLRGDESLEVQVTLGEW